MPLLLGLAFENANTFTNIAAYRDPVAGSLGSPANQVVFPLFRLFGFVFVEETEAQKDLRIFQPERLLQRCLDPVPSLTLQGSIDSKLVLAYSTVHITRTNEGIQMT